MISNALPKVNPDDEEEIRLLRVKIALIQREYERARSELTELRDKFPKG